MDFVLLGHHAGWLGSSWFLLVVAIFLVANALLLFVACLFYFWVSILETLCILVWFFVFVAVGYFWIFSQCFAIVFCLFSRLVLLFYVCLGFWNFGWVLCLFLAVGGFVVFVG